MKPTKRVRRSPEEAKLLILETAERIMIEEGYPAINIRRVASTAGVSTALLHHYFNNVDDLLIALYRHCSDRDRVLLEPALDSEDPVGAIWSLQMDPGRAALGLEFLALANHKPLIREEIAGAVSRLRRRQADALARELGASASGTIQCSAAGLAMLFASVSRNLVSEKIIGIDVGHEDVRGLMEQMLADLRAGAQATD